jgi:hypothetical protein
MYGATTIHLWRYNHRKENNIKLDFTEVGCMGVDWVEIFKNK